MESINHKNFEPFEKVLVKSSKGDGWDTDIYSRWDEAVKKHRCIYAIVDDDSIVPYLGNQQLINPNYSSKVDVKLRPKEWVILHANCLDELIRDGEIVIEQFSKINEQEEFVTVNGNTSYFAIRLEDFDGYDLKASLNEVMHIVNGVIYKGKEHLF